MRPVTRAVAPASADQIAEKRQVATAARTRFSRRGLSGICTQVLPPADEPPLNAQRADRLPLPSRKTARLRHAAQGNRASGRDSCDRSPRRNPGPITERSTGSESHQPLQWEVQMEGNVTSPRVRALAPAGLATVLVLGSALTGEARPASPRPTNELGSAAGLAPDGRSVAVDVIAWCPERWIVLDATSPCRSRRRREPPRSP